MKCIDSKYVAHRLLVLVIVSLGCAGFQQEASSQSSPSGSSISGSIVSSGGGNMSAPSGSEMTGIVGEQSVGVSVSGSSENETSLTSRSASPRLD